MDVLEAMRRRASTRAFLDRPVARATIEAMLEAARWAPSGVDSQPWRVAVVTGNSKRAITEQLLAERVAGKPERPDYRYYPEHWDEPYKSRRVACGLALYKALGIGREDADRRLKAWNNNYSFFGAPAGLFFFIDRRMAQGSWVDMGMFLQNVMLAARGVGLETCPQFALAMYPDVVAQHLDAPAKHDLVCGLSMGYGDPEAPVNRYRTERMAVDELLTWTE